jgi:hypothetical protein
MEAAAAPESATARRRSGCPLARRGRAGAARSQLRPQAHTSLHPADRVEAIGKLRRLRLTAAEIAEALAMALSTASAVLRRIGLGKLSRLEPEPLRALPGGRARPRQRQELGVFAAPTTR